MDGVTGTTRKVISQNLNHNHMAYINGKFEHENYEIIIEVLEPTKDENDFAEGMKVQVDWDFMLGTSLDEFREIIKWMSEKTDYIEQNFTKKGKAKTIHIKG